MGPSVHLEEFDKFDACGCCNNRNFADAQPPGQALDDEE